MRKTRERDECAVSESSEEGDEERDVWGPGLACGMLGSTHEDGKRWENELILQNITMEQERNQGNREDRRRQ